MMRIQSFYYWLLLFLTASSLFASSKASSSTTTTTTTWRTPPSLSSPRRSRSTPLRHVPPQTPQTTKQAIADQFNRRDVRQTFIARVYAILAGQLAVTAASIFVFGAHDGLRTLMHTPGQMGAMVPVLSLILSTVAWVIASVNLEARRKNPVKWQVLALFTAGEAVSVGFLSSFYTMQSVVSAMLATALAATGVSTYTILNKNSKYDLSQWGATLSSFGLIFVVYGIIQILSMVGILPPNFLPYSDMVYGLVGATIFSFYLAYHTRLIVSGKHTKYQMNEQDYVYGAMSLYNDIINLFIYLLRVIGEDRD